MGVHILNGFAKVVLKILINIVEIDAVIRLVTHVREHLIMQAYMKKKMMTMPIRVKLNLKKRWSTQRIIIMEMRSRLQNL
jgi:hypothetical protein